MIDYRENNYELRRELLIQYTGWAYKLLDGDCALWTMKHIFKDSERFDDEDKFWHCWLYANTYNYGQSWAFAQYFPHYNEVTYDALVDFNNKNYERMVYQVDCRYSKGRLPVMFQSYMSMIGLKTQKEFWFGLCTSDDRVENFKTCWNVASKLREFGRYKTWFYLQALREVCGLPIDCPDLLLNDVGSESHRDGLCRGLGKDEWVKRKEKDENGKTVKIRHDFHPDEIVWLNQEADKLMDEINERYGLEVEPLGFETVLCAYKKLFRIHQGRYVGYYLDRQYDDYHKIEIMWPEVDMEPLWKARRELLPHDLLPELKENKPSSAMELWRCETFPNTGVLDWRGHLNEQYGQNVLDDIIKEELTIFDYL